MQVGVVFEKHFQLFMVPEVWQNILFVELKFKYDRRENASLWPTFDGTLTPDNNNALLLHERW